MVWTGKGGIAGTRLLETVQDDPVFDAAGEDSWRSRSSRVVGLHLAVQVTGSGEVLFESGPSFEETAGRGTLVVEAGTSSASVAARVAGEQGSAAGLHAVEAPGVAGPQVLEEELLAAALRRQWSAAPACTKLRGNLAGGASHVARVSDCLPFLVVVGGAGANVAMSAVQEGVVGSCLASAALLALVRANLAQGSSASPTGAVQVAARSWSIIDGVSAFARTQRRLGGGRGSVAASSRLAAAARVAATAAASGVCRFTKSG